MLKKRALAMIISIALAVCVAPAAAFASDLVGARVSVQGTQAEPSAMSVGAPVSGTVDLLDADWYAFTTSSGHSVYSIQLTSHTADKDVRFELYDSAGNRVGHVSTSTTATGSYLLASDSNYLVKVQGLIGGEATYELLVTEVPSNPQYPALGKDRNNPFPLQLGVAVNSQFDDRGGSQDQWYAFTTTARHASYAIELFSRMDNQFVRYDLYDQYGNRLAHESTSMRQTDQYLLSANTTYTLKLSSTYDARSGYPSFELSATEVPSNPQYASLGNDKNNPYKLKLGKTASSQFDNIEGSQEQWYTFKTGSSKRPAFIKLVDKSKTKVVRYDLYTARGKKVDYARTSTVRTDAYALAKNTSYILKVSGSYTGDSGFTSYQVNVSQSKPGKVSKVKASKVRRSGFTVKYAAAKNSNQYQVAYKKASAKKWTHVRSAGKSWTASRLKAKTKYKVKVRGVYYVGGTYYYGAWSKAVSITTKG